MTKRHSRPRRERPPLVRDVVVGVFLQPLSRSVDETISAGQLGERLPHKQSAVTRNANVLECRQEQRVGLAATSGTTEEGFSSRRPRQERLLFRMGAVGDYQVARSLPRHQRR